MRVSGFLSVIFLLALSTTAAANGSLFARGYHYDDEVSFRQSEIELTYRQETSVWRLQHDYRVFDLPDVDGAGPASNGHVHALALRWQHHGSQWHLELAPVLAVSSNVLKHPDSMRASDWQLHGLAIRRQSGPGNSDWWWGLRADSRFGRYLPYPVAQWHKPIGDTLGIAIGLPDSALTWRVHPTWTLGLEAGPAGGYWQVRDDSRDQVSHLEQERWHSSLSVRWQASANIALALGASYFWHEQWTYRLTDGRRTELEVPDHSALTLTLGLGLPSGRQ